MDPSHLFAQRWLSRQQPLSAADAPRQFEAASLFIDDCPNGSVYGITPETIDPNNNPPETPSQQLGLNVDIGFCYDWAGACCWPCGGPGSVAYTDTCNSTFPACNNNCTVSVQETWVCNEDRSRARLTLDRYALSTTNSRGSAGIARLPALATRAGVVSIRIRSTAGILRRRAIDAGSATFGGHAIAIAAG